MESAPIHVLRRNTLLIVHEKPIRDPVLDSGPILTAPGTFDVCRPAPPAGPRGMHRTQFAKMKNQNRRAHFFLFFPLSVAATVEQMTTCSSVGVNDINGLASSGFAGDLETQYLEASRLGLCDAKRRYAPERRRMRRWPRLLRRSTVRPDSAFLPLTIASFRSHACWSRI